MTPEELCTFGCFRVAYCGPVSRHGDSWTEDEKAAHADNDGKW